MDISGTQITDFGLEHLKGLTQLHSVDLSNTGVTDDGVKRLQQMLPKCNIQHYAAVDYGMMASNSSEWPPLLGLAEK